MKTVGFLWKLYKTCFSRHAEDVLLYPNVIFQRLRSKNCSTGLKFTPIGENSSLSMKIVQNVLFTPCGGRFGQMLFFNVWIQKLLYRTKFTPIRENSSLSMKIVQNVLFTPCGGRFGQMLFFNVLDPKIALPDWNLRQYVKTVGFLWKLYKTCFSRHAEDVLAKSHFSTFSIQKLLYRTEIHANTWKQ